MTRVFLVTNSVLMSSIVSATSVKLSDELCVTLQNGMMNTTELLGLRRQTSKKVCWAKFAVTKPGKACIEEVRRRGAIPFVSVPGKPVLVHPIVGATFARWCSPELGFAMDAFLGNCVVGSTMDRGESAELRENKRRLNEEHVEVQKRMRMVSKELAEFETTKKKFDSCLNNFKQVIAKKDAKVKAATKLLHEETLVRERMEKETQEWRRLAEEHEPRYRSMHWENEFLRKKIGGMPEDVSVVDLQQRIESLEQMNARKELALSTLSSELETLKQTNSSLQETKTELESRQKEISSVLL